MQYALNYSGMRLSMSWWIPSLSFEFPWGLWEGTVSAAPEQANNIIKYCI